MATSMELKSISCKGVKSLVPFPKPSLYAVISISNTDNRPNQNHQTKKTPVDRVGGENPDWDQPIRLDLDRHDPNLLLEFNIKAEGIFGNRLVGKVRIAFTDFDFTGAVCHVSYQVRTPDGKPNGVLNFSYTIDGKHNGNHPLPSKPAPPVSYTPSAPPVGYYPSVSVPDRPVSYPSPSPGIGYYPSVSDRPVSYPSPSPGVGYYPSVPVPEPVVSYPLGYYPPLPIDPAVSLYPPVPAIGGYYPASLPVYEVYPPPPPPPPPPACCYPAPEQYSYQREFCDRGLYGYN